MLHGDTPFPDGMTMPRCPLMARPLVLRSAEGEVSDSGQAPAVPLPARLSKCNARPEGRGLKLFGDDHPLGQRLDVAAREPPMSAEGHDMTQLPLPSPPADGFGGHMKKG